MKKKLIAFMCVCLSAPLVWATPAVPTEPEQFQVQERTEVPNVTLQPGSYSIRILDHLRDRVILQVSRSNHVETTFLAIPASTMANAPAGPILFSNGPSGKAALKGFSFPGGTAVEFVYPKNDAVSIAQANDTKVMAIDPASEGRVAAPKLNQSDMQMITLWMLEPSRVGPTGNKQAAISATRYHAPPRSAGTTESAAVQTPAPPASNDTAISTPRATRRQRPVQVAQAEPAPVRTHVRPANVRALPHTASDLPLVWFAALLSFALGGALSLRRFRFGQ